MASRAVLKRYVSALVLVLTAVALELAVRPLLGGRVPLAIFTIAITLSAFGGLGPGLFATALSAACVAAFFANSVFSLLPGQPSLWFFAGLGIGISAVIETFRCRNLELIEAKRRLEAANLELENRAAQLTRSNEELRRFAYALSHDLQTPLRTVSLFTERLEVRLRDKLDEDAASSMRFVLDGVRRAQDMIRSLLDYSTAAGDCGVETVTDLNAALAGALVDLHAEAQENGACMTHDTLPSLRGDAAQLRRVFLNLLSNAIKYRSEKTPVIHVTAQHSENEWVISVRDNGIGIDMRYADKIFNLFERLHSANRYEGSGIGLATCRAIVHRHGGEIWVESEPGRGSTFYFSLPG
ncbi:MAG: DUF4118 domain-containing protein [Acidobacteriia bacterium]|nr:DUF4118 domain-containing protein [Terriglobia bacterium]